MSISFGDVNLLFSGQVTNNSQVMYYRDVQARLSKCAPFLRQERDRFANLTCPLLRYQILC